MKGNEGRRIVYKHTEVMTSIECNEDTLDEVKDTSCLLLVALFFRTVLEGRSGWEGEIVDLDGASTWCIS
jgi:hypothetical protein